MSSRKPYPSDISDEKWSFVAPHLALIREDAAQRNHDLREILNGLKWIVRTGSAWRYMPHDLPPWEAVHQQTRRWLQAGAFEAIINDLRVLLRLSIATFGKQSTRSNSGDTRLLHAALDSRERSASRLLRSKAKERLEGTCRSGHFGTSAGLARQPRR